MLMDIRDNPQAVIDRVRCFNGSNMSNYNNGYETGLKYADFVHFADKERFIGVALSSKVQGTYAKHVYVLGFIEGYIKRMKEKGLMGEDVHVTIDDIKRVGVDVARINMYGRTK